ncbi:MAG: membrane protein insertase YidC [Polyangiaceae bacterium]|nr:membrane protein insertase YidC [Polyangiaceae bacterium]
MEQGGIARWLLIGILAVLLLVVLPRWWSGGSEVQPLLFEPDRVENPENPGKPCDIWTPYVHAKLSTRGGTLVSYVLLTAKYVKKDEGLDLATTPNVPLRQQLRFDWRNPAAAPDQDRGTRRILEGKYWQTDYDLLLFELTEADGKSCTFRYRDAEVELTRVVRATERPYELEATETIKNLAREPRLHALSVHTTAWRTTKEVAGHMFRVSPYVTNVECALAGGTATRLTPSDFDAKDFEKQTDNFLSDATNLGDWYEVPGQVSFAGVSNAYFSHALVPLEAPSNPTCQLQIEMIGDKSDPRSGAMYRARLAYTPMELRPGESQSYAVLTYIGPKERRVLAAAADGKHDLSELINLGFFSVIAKVLVSFLLYVYGVVGDWGLAIIVLTVTARTLLFPLTIPSLRSMIKMRELKPEIDALNQKYKDDAQAKGVAQMELWRKHKVNPFIGCLPQLATIPVWFALYQTLQTAVELYNIPFLWFPDLSEPDPFFVLPFVIGATSFVQQKMMPMQGGDPTQQKMMLYMMPAMFTVFMLFLPAGLGVYMFTNSLLGIAQQQAVEWHVRRTVKPRTPGGTDASPTGSEAARHARIHGKRRARRDGGEDTKKDEDQPGADGVKVT